MFRHNEKQYTEKQRLEKGRSQKSSSQKSSSQQQHSEKNQLQTDRRQKRRTIRVPQRLRRFAHILDSAIPLPGGFRIGVESIVGLIPGIGDVFGAMASCYIIAEGIRLGAPASVVVRMVSNVLLESTIGMVPVIGDLFDVAYKSNIRNIALLNELEERPAAVNKTSRLWLWLIFGMITLVLVLFIWLTISLLMALGSSVLSLFT
jgi:hypothetical protein